MNHNERFDVEAYLKLILVSSGYELGSSNIVFEFYDKKVSVLTKSSTFKYRYPKELDFSALGNSDVLISFPDLINYKNDYESSLLQLNSEIYKIVSKQEITSLHYPSIFMPTEWSFLLDFVDLLKYKIPQEVKNIYISSSIKAILEYSNISHSFINAQIHNKIYEFKLPFAFDDLIKNERLYHYQDFEDFLKNFLNNKNNFNNMNSSPIMYMVNKFSFAFGEAQTIFENFVNNSTSADALIYLNLKLKNVHENFTSEKNSDFKFKIFNFNLDHRLTFEQYRQILLDNLKPSKFYYFDKESKNLDFAKFIINSTNNLSEKIPYYLNYAKVINFNDQDIKYEKLFFQGRDSKEFDNFVSTASNNPDKLYNIKVEKENDNLFVKLAPLVNLFKPNRSQLEILEDDLNQLLVTNNMSVIEFLAKENSIKISIVKKNQPDQVDSIASYSDVSIDIREEDEGSDINILSENHEDSLYLNEIFQLIFSH